MQRIISVLLAATWWLPRRIARARASIRTKLLAAFLLVVALMLAAGAVGLQALSDTQRRTDEMAQMQRKIAAYQQINHDTVSQLHGVAAALIEPDEHTLANTVRQLNQFGYDLDRLQYISQDEAKLHSAIRRDFDAFVGMVIRVVELTQLGRVKEGRALQLSQVNPLAARLERTMNELVNKAQEALIESAHLNRLADERSRTWVSVFTLVSICLALILGFAISWSLIEPVRAMEQRMLEIAQGDFSRQALVPNRDELGALATDLNRMSQRLAHLYDELQTASRHKSEFLATMSHELRTPLTAIIGGTEVLQAKIAGDLNARQLHYLQDIHASSRHLLSLINDILDLARIEAGKTELELTRFDLAGTIEHVLAVVRAQSEARQLNVRFYIAPELGSFVADERKVRQVLLNLISNAVKFTPQGGRIEVRAEVDAGSARFSVHDSGIGIASEDHEAIFEQFRQVGTDPLRKRAGSGLGLAIARKFIELHGGRIWVESTPGEGSLFTFTLPLRTEGVS